MRVLVLFNLQIVGPPAFPRPAAALQLPTCRPIRHWTTYSSLPLNFLRLTSVQLASKKVSQHCLVLKTHSSYSRYISTHLRLLPPAPHRPSQTSLVRPRLDIADTTSCLQIPQNFTSHISHFTFHISHFSFLIRCPQQHCRQKRPCTEH